MRNDPSRKTSHLPDPQLGYQTRNSGRVLGCETIYPGSHQAVLNMNAAGNTSSSQLRRVLIIRAVLLVVYNRPLILENGS